MINFTKRYVNTISLIISIIIFYSINNYIIYFQQIDLKNVTINQYPPNIEEVNNKCIEKNTEAKNEEEKNTEEKNDETKKVEEKNTNEKNNEAKKVEEKNTNEKNNEAKKIEENNKTKESMSAIEEVQKNNKVEKSTSNVTQWQIEIPKINLKAPISEGTSKDILDLYVGHFENTAKEKEKGNIGLIANNSGGKVNYFQNLKKLKEGDEIIYTYNSKKIKYIVKEQIIIKDEDLNELLKNKEDDFLILITFVENESKYRRCIQAKELEM